MHNTKNTMLIVWFIFPKHKLLLVHKTVFGLELILHSIPKKNNHAYSKLVYISCMGMTHDNHRVLIIELVSNKHNHSNFDI